MSIIFDFNDYFDKKTNPSIYIQKINIISLYENKNYIKIVSNTNVTFLKSKMFNIQSFFYLKT